MLIPACPPSNVSIMLIPTCPQDIRDDRDRPRKTRLRSTQIQIQVHIQTNTHTSTDIQIQIKTASISLWTMHFWSQNLDVSFCSRAAIFNHLELIQGRACGQSPLLPNRLLSMWSVKRRQDWCIQARLYSSGPEILFSYASSSTLYPCE